MRRLEHLLFQLYHSWLLFIKLVSASGLKQSLANIPTHSGNSGQTCSYDVLLSSYGASNTSTSFWCGPNSVTGITYYQEYPSGGMCTIHHIHGAGS